LCAAILKSAFKKSLLGLDSAFTSIDQFIKDANMMDQVAFVQPLCCNDLTITSIRGFAIACLSLSIAMAMDAIAYALLIILTLLVCSAARLGCQKMAA